MSTAENEPPLEAPTCTEMPSDMSTESAVTRNIASSDNAEMPNVNAILDSSDDTIKQSNTVNREESKGDDFLRLRAKMRELKRKAQDITKSKPSRLSSDPEQETVRERSDVLLGMELGNRYHVEGFDQLYTYMPDEYRRNVDRRSHEELQFSANQAALKAKPSPFIKGYIHPQNENDDPSFEFTRRRLQARYSYEREMEYLYAIQERYDATRAAQVERVRLKEEAERRAKAAEEERKRPTQLPEAGRWESLLEVSEMGQEEDSSQENHDEELILPAQIDYTEASLNPVEWTSFKSLGRQHPPKYVIDVLVGEPVLSYDVMGIPINRKSADKNEDMAKDRKAAAKNILRGQAPVPERIRINSEPLMAILRKVHGEKIGNLAESVIMTRPFKALSYYEDKIRRWYEELAKMHRVHAGDSEPKDAEYIHAGGLEPKDSKYVHAGDSEPEDSESSESDGQSEHGWDNLPNPLLALRHLACLVQFIDTVIKERLDYLESVSYQHVTFSDLGYLFSPGDEVIDKYDRQAYRILSVTSPRHKGVPWNSFWNNYRDGEEEKAKPMRIHCVYVDFDGKRLGPVSKEFEIAEFEGEKNISFLPLRPLRFSNGPYPNLRKELVERGKKFVAMAAVKHMHCSGVTLDTRDEVDSQVVIDFAEALSVPGNRAWKPPIEEFVGDIPEREDGETCTAECCRRETVHDDSYVDYNRNKEFMASLNPQDRTKLPSVIVYPRSLEVLGGEENKLTDNELLVMSYRVFGFVLRTRKWAQLDLLDLVDVQHNEDNQGHKRETSFDKLVLPDGHKQIVQSLIAQHFRDKELGASKSDQVDFVRGKGKGLILLLHGSPGVGKTTTAECVADLFQKPLFQLTCGDLGSTAAEVEATLETNFSLANRWGCILLLDEADVFLAARSPTDFQRNGLVAVFLCVLEYYAGILFLTTNRVGDFDEAFASRIHISLYYQPLDEDSTIKVFKLNLDMIKDRFRRKDRKLEIDEQILKFAREHYLTKEKARWNGRQIRNACQTALALAEFEAQGGKHDAVVDASAEVRLQQKHFKTVADAYLEFTQYLKDIFGTFAEERAQEKNLRAHSKQPEILNPLVSPNNQSSQSGFGYNLSTAQPNYPAGPMGQGPGTYYYQPTYQQAPSPGFAYGGPGNLQMKPQQAPQAWPSVNAGVPGSLNAANLTQQGHPSTVASSFTHGQPNISQEQPNMLDPRYTSGSMGTQGHQP